LRRLNLEKDRVARANHWLDLLTPVSSRVSLRAGAGVSDSGVFWPSVNSSNSGHLSATTSIVSTQRASFAGSTVCVNSPMATTWLVNSCSTSRLCFTLLIYNRFNRWSKAGIWDKTLQSLVTMEAADLQCIDSTTSKAHRSSEGGADEQAIGRCRGGLHHQNPCRRRPLSAPGD
jgi:hypothetical protein